MCKVEYTHALYFNGCPKFYGTEEECKREYNKKATSERLKRFYQIKSKKEIESIVARKMAHDAVMSPKPLSAPEYDKDGDFVYYR